MHPNRKLSSLIRISMVSSLIFWGAVPPISSAPFEGSVSGRLEVLGSGGGPRPGGPGIDFNQQFEVKNAANYPRTETVLASIPFSYGVTRDVDGFGVSGRATAWMVMQRGPDE